MSLKSIELQRSGHGWRPLLITAVILVYPSLGACSQSGTGNESTASAQAPARMQQSAGDSGAMSNNMGGGMSNHMGGGMADTQAQGGSDKPVQVAAADSGSSGSSDNAGNGGEQKREPMDGYTVYSRFCVMCHKTGMNGAPKYGNKEAWGPRIAQGKETLYHAAINGLRAMPPKGGIAGLYDSEVKDAVDYMVKAAGGWDSGGSADSSN